MSNLAKFYIGTSGWSYPKGKGTWTGYFYPIGKNKEGEYLRSSSCYCSLEKPITFEVTSLNCFGI